MSAAPLHAFSAPVAGSGKSKLVNLAAILATGHYAPVTALSGSPDEGEKRLSSSMLAGDAVIALDNIERPLGGEFLCQLLTETLRKCTSIRQIVNCEDPKCVLRVRDRQ